MAIFDKTAIENFAIKVDEKVKETTFSTLSFAIQNAIDELAKKNAMISKNIELIPVNEFFSGAVLPNSKLDVLLVLKSPQLEFNTVKLVNDKLKSFWLRVKEAWKNRKKKKKKDKYINKIKTEELATNENYNFRFFAVDFINCIANNITNTSVVNYKNGVFEIMGEEFPFTCRIFPVIDKTGSYNFYEPKKNKFINIDFQSRHKNLEVLYSNYGEDFLELNQIFSAVYFNIFSSLPNSLYIESLIANLPKETFDQKTIYGRFIFAVNYFINKKSSDFFAITDTNKKIYEEILCDTTLPQISSFMKNLQKYL